MYRFYTDLDDTNKMVAEIKEAQMEELKKFHKSYFDVENILNTASDLKFTNELKALITFIVKSILRETIDPKRIKDGDTQSYFAILLDDHNRKTICRLYLGGRYFKG